MQNEYKLTKRLDNSFDLWSQLINDLRERLIVMRMSLYENSWNWSTVCITCFCLQLYFKLSVDNNAFWESKQTFLQKSVL